MSGLRPFFTYYGGKWRAAPRYPAPFHNLICEPFAGSAGYSLRHYERNVVLCEKDERLVALWRYLFRATASEIRALPDVPNDGTVEDLTIPEEAKSLIGFWLNKGVAAPCQRPSAWMRSGIRPKSFWGPEVRNILAAQAGKIAHWKIIEGDYSMLSMNTATWFVDPPYVGAGKYYRHNSKAIDYAVLAKWCRSLYGQAIVCENAGADWLPFVPFMSAKATHGKQRTGRSQEVVYLQG